MAARIEAAPKAPTPELVDLRYLRAENLDDLLDEEIRTWHDSLWWDFSKSADLVRRFVDLRALNGCALVQSGEIAGYSYYVVEEHKGLVGDVYVRREAYSRDSERRLLERVLDCLINGSQVTRIESQLMLIGSLRTVEAPFARFLNTYERNFMVFEFGASALPGPPRRSIRRRIYVERWSEQYQESAAQVISDAYAGHVDSSINDQYRSLAGARRFLFNIVQYPGCGVFYKPGSFAAFDYETGGMCGLCLASLVSPHCGHITQICVSPVARGTGVGYELLRCSLAAMRHGGATRASLTVTASNIDAVALYESVGFRTARTFSAYVWEGF